MIRVLSFVFILSFGCIFISCGSKPKGETTSQIPAPDGYELIWHDEFNSEGIPDPEFWSHEHGFVRNEELQWYQPQNARVEDGLLVITGKREEVENPNYDAQSSAWAKSRKKADYTSSSINTRGKFSFKYGILEVRAKIDTASGMWPAIWTLGIDRGWPSNGEIDVMEYYRIDGKPHLLANAAWGANWKNVSWDSEAVPFRDFLEKDPDWPTKFHIWKMEWSEEHIKLYLDGELINEIDLEKTENPDGFNGFYQPHYILLNLAIGSNGGDPSETQFPKKYLVDYVRVFQKKIID